MGYFPFFMEIEGKNGVIVGGGRVAAQKVEKLLAFGPVLTVIAPRIEGCMRAQEKQFRRDAAASLCLIERAFLPEDLDGADFVIAATNDKALNGRIAAHCKAARILVNVVDDREKCSFFFPALVKRGDLTVGISTNGHCPVAASWVRQEISEMLPEGLGDTIDLMGQIRPAVLRAVTGEENRKALLAKMFLYCMEHEGKVTAEELLEFL